MNKINVMDCTLRDGGWVNSFAFGRNEMREILAGIAKSGIEHIEMGYMDVSGKSETGYSMYSDFSVLGKNFADMPGMADIQKYVMIDYGKFPIEMIPDRNSECGKYTDGIRLCFHKKDYPEAVAFGKGILAKGYNLIIQPMVVSRYSDDDLKSLMELVMKEIPEVHAFYIVDSFGVMDPEETTHRLILVDSFLDEKIALGTHIHNNRNLCMINAEAACRLTKEKNREHFSTGRDLYIDTTLGGIGKGAGNLQTERLVDYLNRQFFKGYNEAAISSLNERYIDPLREKFVWGFSEEYVLTSVYRATPSYAKTLYREYGLTLDELKEFLMNMPEDKKDSFDREYAEAYVKEMRGEYE
jgi:4-hydroxy 2-oxovalerate aldolase